MPDARLTRANTLPGTPERKAVYAREYAERNTRALQAGVSYGQARQLRALFPLSAPTRQELKRNHRAVGQAHTRYAIIRAQLARQQEADGTKALSAKQRQSLRVLREPLGGTNPVAELAQWYAIAYGNDYDASNFGGYNPPAAEGPTGDYYGAGLEGYAGDYTEEELYDVGWSDIDEWDVWEFVEIIY